MGNITSLRAFNETSRALKRQEQLWDTRNDTLACGNQKNLWDSLLIHQNSNFLLGYDGKLEFLGAIVGMQAQKYIGH